MGLAIDAGLIIKLTILVLRASPMSKTIGFVILSHNNPQQLHRLVLCLRRVYDGPPIVVHHDFSQSKLQRQDFPSDVNFVTPHVRTSWGDISTVTATLRAIEALYQNAAPDWFILLSSGDYPTMSANKVIEELASSGMDALLDYRQVPNLSDASYQHRYRIRASRYSADVGALQFDEFCPQPENPALRHFGLSRNLALAWRRYIGYRASLPMIRRGPRLDSYVINLPFADRRSPFTRKFKCYFGDQWFAGNAKAAEALLNPNDEYLKLSRFLSSRPNADECYYQTVLVNTPGLKITTATKRYADWSQSAGGPRGGPHPKTLDLDDLPSIISSKSHFARKFAANSPALDEIDRMLS